MSSDSLKFTDPLQCTEETEDGIMSEDKLSGVIPDSDSKRNGVDAATLLNPAHVFRYVSVEECVDLEDRIQEFLASLFYVLESKRLDRSYEKLDHMTLLKAPFELHREASVGDSDSRY